MTTSAHTKQFNAIVTNPETAVQALRGTSMSVPERRALGAGLESRKFALRLEYLTAPGTEQYPHRAMVTEFLDIPGSAETKRAEKNLGYDHIRTIVESSDIVTCIRAAAREQGLYSVSSYTTRRHNGGKLAVSL